MNLARILYPVNVLGPGKRIGLWLAGCARKCKGCSNPELWNQQKEYEISVSNIMQLIHKIQLHSQIDGFTITGGEPMDQTEGLAELIKDILPISPDILVYTGYPIDELRVRRDESTQYVLNHIGVLIDGSYIETLNDNTILRGSSNQKMFILNQSLEPLYNSYLAEAVNEVQNFTTSDGIISVGIHHPGFRQPV